MKVFATSHSSSSYTLNIVIFNFRDLQTHSTLFFKLRDPQDLVPLHCYSHKFICIAPFSNDSLLLINVPKVAVDPILKVRMLYLTSIISLEETTFHVGHSFNY